MAGRTLIRPGVLWYVCAYAFALAEALPYVSVLGGWTSPWAWLALITPVPMVWQPFTYKADFVPESK